MKLFSTNYQRNYNPPLEQRRHKADYWLLLVAVSLLTIGLVVVYAISPALSQQRSVGENFFISKQLLAVLLGMTAFLITSWLPIHWWRKLEKPLIILTIVTSLFVFIFGDKVNGATRWIQLGGFSFQPAELAKFSLLIWVSGYLVDKVKNQNQDYTKLLKPLLIVMLVIGLVIGGLQSDLGSTGVMVAMLGVMIFVAGIPLKKVFLISLVILIGVVLLISISPYRRDRLLTYIHPERDCISKGYQSCQALIAIGSGGVMGLGLGHSVQAYGYVPEAANDSIFSIYAEKFGFIGVIVLLVLYGVFFYRILKIIDHTTDDYSQYLATGILTWISFQSIINIGAMLGLLPLKGITLPFISYGGTSLLFVMASLGLLFQLSRYTSYRLPLKAREGSLSNENTNDGRRIRGAYHPFDSRR